MKSSSKAAASEATVTMYVLTFGTLLAIALGSVLATVVSCRISGTLSQVVSRAAAIADGDLTDEKLTTSSKDEIAELADSMNHMQGKLRELMSQIGQNAQALGSASEEIAASATQASQGSRMQNDQATQVATGMQEMSSTVAQVSENANKAADTAREAFGLAEEGGKVVEATLESMRQGLPIECHRLRKRFKNWVSVPTGSEKSSV